TSGRGRLVSGVSEMLNPIPVHELMKTAARGVNVGPRVTFTVRRVCEFRPAAAAVLFFTVLCAAGSPQEVEMNARDIFFSIKDLANKSESPKEVSEPKPAPERPRAGTPRKARRATDVPKPKLQAPDGTVTPQPAPDASGTGSADRIAKPVQRPLGLRY